MASNRPVKRFRFAADVVGSGVTAAPPAPRPRNEDPQAGLLRRAITDKFSEWRRGNYDWNAEDRRAQISAVVHPRPGEWDPWDLREPPDDQMAAVRANRLIYQEVDANRPSEETLRRRAVVEEQASIDLIQPFQALGFTSARVLGAGGHTVVFKFGTVDRDGKRSNVAVKFNTRRGMSDEVRALKVMLFHCLDGEFTAQADNPSD